MKERPILFSGPMVRAILEGRKTMTRRVVKMPYLKLSLGNFDGQAIEIESHPKGFFALNASGGNKLILCPYGVPGDRLWVRETFTPDFIHNRTYYRADSDTDGIIPYELSGAGGWGGGIATTKVEKWKPSIFMPRAAARILLEVADVRVERLQDIKRSGAIAEGVGTLSDDFTDGVDFFADAVDAFSSLWQSINGPDSWDQNPWVWVVEFRKIEQA